ncbi:phage head-tail joining protein [Chitiniphilus eburneus]|uniref:phage head-tail joining protein n=1 Tax=Chitiniphilus eburneus TaxID=2571148 RepID=UPI0035D035B0
MAFTADQLARLEAAIAKGERVVQYDGRRVEYRTIDELIRARDEIRAALASQDGPRSRVIRLYHAGKGV